MGQVGSPLKFVSGSLAHGERFRPLKHRATWDPFQMAQKWLKYMGVILTTETSPGMIEPK